MADVAHSTLTGSNLHEPKGVAAASSGTVYVADGLGSGAWTSLSGAQNPFGSALLHVGNLNPSSVTTPGTAIEFTRNIDTVYTNEIVGASLSSNQITLPSGTYYCEGWVIGVFLPLTGPSLTGLQQQCKLRNVTDASTIYKFTPWVTTTANTQQIAHNYLSGRFTIVATKLIDIRQEMDATASTTCEQGIAGPAGSSAEIRFWKIS